jgi:hypothetical protein
MKTKSLGCITAMTLFAALTISVQLFAQQDNGFDGPRTIQIPQDVILPPAPVYSNCGVGCTSYNSSTAYAISGTGVSSTYHPGETIATKFTPAATVTFTKALEANYCCFEGSSVNAVAYLMTSVGDLPGKVLTKMVSKGCPGATGNLKVCKFLPPKGTKITLKKGASYWLCQDSPSPTTSYGWVLSVSNDSTATNFAYNDAAACVAKTWAQVGAGVIRPAFEIN